MTCSQMMADEAHVVLDDQHGHAAVADCEQAVGDLDGERGIDAGHRLVEEQELRMPEKRPPELDELLLAAREVGGAIVRDVRRD